MNSLEYEEDERTESVISNYDKNHNSLFKEPSSTNNAMFYNFIFNNVITY